VMSSKIQPAMEILADVVRHPTFKSDEVERLRQQYLDNVTLALGDPGTIARMVAARVVFGDSPYGHPVSGTTESLTRELDDIRSLLDQGLSTEAKARLALLIFLRCHSHSLRSQGLCFAVSDRRLAAFGSMRLCGDNRSLIERATSALTAFSCAVSHGEARPLMTGPLTRNSAAARSPSASAST